MYFNRLMLAIALCTGSGLVACGGVQEEMGELRTSLAQNWGVKMRSVTVKHKDLGKNYAALKGTSFDFLGKDAPKNRRVKIRYHAFGLPSVDDFNRRANILFAKYTYTDNLVDMFMIDAKQIVRRDIRKMSLKGINKTLRANRVKRTKRKSVHDYRKVRSDFGRILRSYKRIANEAKSMYESGKKMVKNAPSEFRKDPKKAIYADKMIIELKDSIKRLSDIVESSAGLSKRIAHVKKFTTALDNQYEE